MTESAVSPADAGQPLTACIADASPGVLAAAITQRAGRPYRRAIPYADRHRDNPLMPTLMMNMGRLNRNIRPRRVTAIRLIRGYGDYF
jgi:hypothetical protein